MHKPQCRYVSLSLDLKTSITSFQILTCASQDFPRDFPQGSRDACVYGEDNLNKNNGMFNVLVVLKSFLYTTMNVTEVVQRLFGGWAQVPDGWAQAPDGWAQVPDGWAQVPDGWAQIIDDWAQAHPWLR